MAYNFARWRLFWGLGHLIAFAYRERINFIPYSIYRSLEEQKKRYDEGASDVLEGPHQDWRALDGMVLDDNWEPDWENIEAYKKLGACWKSLGPEFIWGGDFTLRNGIHDYNHFEVENISQGEWAEQKAKNIPTDSHHSKLRKPIFEMQPIKPEDIDMKIEDTIVKLPFYYRNKRKFGLIGMIAAGLLSLYPPTALLAQAVFAVSASVETAGLIHGYKKARKKNERTWADIVYDMLQLVLELFKKKST